MYIYMCVVTSKIVLSMGLVCEEESAAFSGND